MTARQKFLKKAFLLGGAIIGILASGWYLYRLHGNQQLSFGAKPDSVTTQIVNVGLIFFAAFVQCRLLGRVACWLVGRGKESPGGGG